MRTFIKSNPKVMSKFRYALGFSQAEFAKELGVTTNTVARWERGEIFPPRLAELAAGFIYMRAMDEHQEIH